jgi:hypothetical protein
MDVEVCRERAASILWRQNILNVKAVVYVEEELGRSCRWVARNVINQKHGKWSAIECSTHPIGYFREGGSK